MPELRKGMRMKKFWSGFRKEADKNARENRDRVRAVQLKQLRHHWRLADTRQSQNIVNS